MFGETMKSTIICLFNIVLTYFVLTIESHSESVLLELLERSDVVIEVETIKVASCGFARFGGFTVAYTTVQAAPVQWFKGAPQRDRDQITFTVNRLLHTDYWHRQNDKRTDEKYFRGELILAPIFPDIQEHKRYVVFLSKNPKRNDGVFHLSDRYCGIHNSTVYLKEELNRLAEIAKSIQKTPSSRYGTIESDGAIQYQEKESNKASEAIGAEAAPQPQR